ncbi:MAG: aldehyde dehydrogenase family protein [Sedimentitalea sp.]|uniref:aldehyde dehydrogenase family protein n=1 Tax=Sedimentitalea sp. TaxID=2048915 RepID=UPI00326403E7
MFGRIASAGAADVDRAVASARQALQGDWGRLNAAERGRLLLRAGQIVVDRAEELASLRRATPANPLHRLAQASRPARAISSIMPVPLTRFTAKRSRSRMAMMIWASRSE